ncbi:DinB family protein [Mucilaginibacter phyllosphaerae]|uniref:Damage-inducible protein DinB n=1 Tax=Mucilaginibacter phyllosphaerae TaxID=1812349 RepID=A0A4Y8AEC7_9SPHI|nr:DinB family protein [Mucilaginibacter phyllosphaerae]MBB3970045.1 putative damage-inducible protein DinB [Mucilaginibacter phyllosphaerae]TEW66439.1 damage-inducible protein DinB [Mucilaginibacter phyllosphaerae]GGH09392.1 DNA damage-inducible protein DinB [Mucilaginibacter phyllosphaerae]
MTTTAATDTTVLTADELLKNWQSHRGLSRRVLAAFPEKDLFEFSIGGMRPYSELAGEMIGLASAGMNGFVTGKWETSPELDHFNHDAKLTTKSQFLEAWDEVTDQIDALWPQIPAEHFHEKVAAFGQYENSVTNTILYFLDNEIHHRGQGYVYLRALGIEPPAFWDR